jgi:hypothetical protein
MSLAGWISEEALWRSVAVTLDEEILPALDGPAAAVALQLSGLARYALHRGVDPGPVRCSRLAAELGLLAVEPWAAMAEASAVRLRADRRQAGGGESVVALRSLLVSFVGEDIRRAAPLLETFARHGVERAGNAPAGPAEMAQLQQWFSRWMPGALVASAQVISGGHSRRMLDVRVDTAGGPEKFVVRVEQGGVFGTDGRREARVMQALAAAGIPIARIRWVEESPAALGYPFFVMDRVEGSSDVDDTSLIALADTLRDLHRLPLGAVAGAFDALPDDADAGVEAAITHWERIYRDAAGEAIPLLDDAAAR